MDPMQGRQHPHPKMRCRVQEHRAQRGASDVHGQEHRAQKGASDVHGQEHRAQRGASDVHGQEQGTEGCIGCSAHTCMHGVASGVTHICCSSLRK